MIDQRGVIVSVQVGEPRIMRTTTRIDQRHEDWTSTIFKNPTHGPVWVGRLNVAGDGQADLENHGGPDNAVLAYDAAHYPIWREVLDLPDLAFGGFGENFTVEGFFRRNRVHR